MGNCNSFLFLKETWNWKKSGRKLAATGKGLFCACACVCVCVSGERERERERELVCERGMLGLNERIYRR